MSVFNGIIRLFHRTLLLFTKRLIPQNTKIGLYFILISSTRSKILVSIGGKGVLKAASKFKESLKHLLKKALMEISMEEERSSIDDWPKRLAVCVESKDGDRFNSCQVIYSHFGLAIHQNDHQARRRFVEWTQNEIAVVPDFDKRILFSDEAHFWLNGYVNKQNCRIWSEANPQVYVETPLHPEKLTVWCALWAGGILLQKR
ncbi:hypothetical protein TNCV_4203741 [Trichonephila clavipes]|nr:hypothetical protein TNCV_4203741 [Trichonephila clavipes]